MKKHILFYLLSISFILPANVNGQSLWSEGILIPETGRTNILNLDPITQQKYILKGKLHAQIYPVEITGALPPLHAVENLFNNQDSTLFQIILKTLAKEKSGYESFDDMIKGLGLHPYPATKDIGVYAVPYPHDQRPDYRLGFGVIEKNKTPGFTFSCAACHSGNLFGKTILGLTNRFPHANEYFVKMIQLSPAIKPLINTWLFDQATQSTTYEKIMFTDTFNNLDRVQAVMPITIGLDTTLSHISRSLNKRSDDAWATPNLLIQNLPRTDPFLDLHPADSKPAVWWTTKYKNRWLSDGSIVSGNPVITNLLWNEIGRGTDLKQLGTWIKSNQQKIDEITAAIFATESPRITDFFSEQELGGTSFLAQAQKGESLFIRNCAKCHGSYEKKWSEMGSENLLFSEQINTTQVKYKKNTSVIDIGTDPNRYLGMKSLEKMNKLQLSKDNGVLVKAQKGYVAPPLVGIWARWPYFHNNSVPNLCAILTEPSQRPKIYYAGEANDKNIDFDKDCNGYPLGNKTPLSWKTNDYKYDTSKEGLHNYGHDEGVFLEDGKEKFSPEDKKNLIRFLQTL